MAGTNRSTTIHNGQRAGIPTISTRVCFLVAVALLGWACRACKANGPSFGFTIHHRFSDPVRAIFPAGHNQRLPEMGTFEYFAAMAERDRIHGRRLANGNASASTPLTFVAGNTTHRIDDYGFLYYANVSVGTPGTDFLVALDTGSDLLWLPCDCISCYESGAGEKHHLDVVWERMKFNAYGLSSSSTGKKVPCSSSSCDRSISCSTTPEQCPYKRDYLSENTSSSGYLVEDVMHLTTDSNPSLPVDATITFGCGKIQTGGFLDGGAPNGLFGLDMSRISVPSILAKQNITADSFSMCFGPGKVGRISFGDKGSSNQAETPFVLQQYQLYLIRITETVIGKNASSVGAAVIFDTGTSFTYFTDPIYSSVTSAFNSQVQDKRYPSGSRIPFEYCYQKSPCRSFPDVPSIRLKMGDGAIFDVTDPLVFLLLTDQTCVYCLGIIKEDRINFGIIGENFMYGYRMVFDREKKVLGWQESDCNYEFESTGYSPRNGSAAAPTAITSPGQPPRSKGHRRITDLEYWALALMVFAIQI